MFLGKKNKSYREIITFRYLKTSFVKKKKKIEKTKTDLM